MGLAKIIKAFGDGIVSILKAIVCTCKGGCCESDCNQPPQSEPIVLTLENLQSSLPLHLPLSNGMIISIPSLDGRIKSLKDRKIMIEEINNTVKRIQSQSNLEITSV